MRRARAPASSVGRRADRGQWHSGFVSPPSRSGWPAPGPAPFRPPWCRCSSGLRRGTVERPAPITTAAAAASAAAPRSTIRCRGSTPSWRWSWRWAFRSGPTMSTTTRTACAGPMRSGSDPSGSWPASWRRCARSRSPPLHRLRRCGAGRRSCWRRRSPGGSSRSGSSASWPGGPTPAARGPTATSASVSSSSSCSSAWSPRRARPTSSTRRSSPSTGGRPATTTYPWGFVLWAGVPSGLLAAALLQANNLRDIETDTEAGKKTLAVRLGRQQRRAPLLLHPHGRGPVHRVAARLPGRGRLLALLAMPLAFYPVRLALSDRNGRRLFRCWARRHVSRLAVGAPSDHRTAAVSSACGQALGQTAQPVT